MSRPTCPGSPTVPRRRLRGGRGAVGGRLHLHRPSSPCSRAPLLVPAAHRDPAGARRGGRHPRSFRARQRPGHPPVALWTSNIAAQVTLSSRISPPAPTSSDLPRLGHDPHPYLWSALFQLRPPGGASGSPRASRSPTSVWWGWSRSSTRSGSCTPGRDYSCRRPRCTWPRPLYVKARREVGEAKAFTPFELSCSPPSRR